MVMDEEGGAVNTITQLHDMSTSHAHPMCKRSLWRYVKLRPLKVVKAVIAHAATLPNVNPATIIHSVPRLANSNIPHIRPDEPDTKVLDMIKLHLSISSWRAYATRVAYLVLCGRLLSPTFSTNHSPPFHCSRARWIG